MAKKVSASQRHKNELITSRTLARSGISRKSMDRMGRKLYSPELRKLIRDFEKTLHSKAVKMLYKKLETEGSSPADKEFLARLEGVLNPRRTRKAVKNLAKKLSKNSDRKRLSGRLSEKDKRFVTKRRKAFRIGKERP